MPRNIWNELEREGMVAPTPQRETDELFLLQADRMDELARAISQSFTFSQTAKGFPFWYSVVQELRREARRRRTLAKE